MLNIQGATHSHTPSIQHMGINHGRFDILVTKQLLYRANVLAILQQMRCKAMAKSFVVAFSGATLKTDSCFIYSS